MSTELSFHDAFTGVREVDTLSELCLAIGNEDYGLEGIGAMLDKRMPKLRIALSKAFQFATTWNYTAPSLLNPRPLDTLLRKTQFTTIGHVTVAIPVSFKGNLHDYVEQFEEKQLQAVFSMVRLLDDVSKRYATYINDPGALNERYVPMGGNTFNAAHLVKQLETVKAAEVKFVDPTNRTGEARLDVTFDSLSQIVQTEERLNAINKQYWKNASPDLITDKVRRLNELAASLFSTVELEGAVNKDVMTHLLEELEIVARWVELYSVLITRLLDTNSAMSFTQDKLVKML